MAVGGIVDVAVRIPVGRVYVDLHVAADLAQAGLDQEGGVDEVGAGLQVPFAGVEDGGGFAAVQREAGGAEMRVEPETLEVALGPVETRAVGDAWLENGGWLNGQHPRIGVSEMEGRVFHFFVSRSVFGVQR